MTALPSFSAKAFPHHTNNYNPVLEEEGKRLDKPAAKAAAWQIWVQSLFQVIIYTQWQSPTWTQRLICNWGQTLTKSHLQTTTLRSKLNTASKHCSKIQRTSHPDSLPLRFPQTALSCLLGAGAEQLDLQFFRQS